MSDTTPTPKKRKPSEYRTLAANKARAEGRPSRYIKQHGTYDDCMAYTERGIWSDRWGGDEPTQQSETPPAPAGRGSGTAIKYVRLYPHDLFGDPRMLELGPIQQQRWVYLLLHMSRYMGTIPDDTKAIGRLLDVSPREAEQLVRRLTEVGLLVRSAAGTKLCSITSPRMRAECEHVLAMVQTAAERARKGGEGKAAKRKGRAS
jgi:hypothetical protein